MARVVYVNGVDTPYAEACVHARDPAYQIADRASEVCEVPDGRLAGGRCHLPRLRRARLNRVRASCTARIVTGGGKLVTRRAESGILPGITREVVKEAARRSGLTYAERPFPVRKAEAAHKSVQTSAKGLVMPVVKIDGQLIGNSKPGEVALGLRARISHGRGNIIGPGTFNSGSIVPS